MLRGEQYIRTHFTIQDLSKRVATKTEHYNLNVGFIAELVYYISLVLAWYT